MSNSDDKNQAASLPVGAPPMDVEGQTPASGVSAITRRSRRDDLLKRGSLALRGVALFFSLIAFIVMVSNKHGDGKDFDEYEEFRYVLAIAILSTLYTGGQTLRHSYEMSTGKQLLQPRTSALFDFSGDQVEDDKIEELANGPWPPTVIFQKNFIVQMGQSWKEDGPVASGKVTVAYLLISAASAAIPMTNRMREGGDNIFTDSLAASISMEILAFIALALSALISGYRLTTQSQI